MRLAGSRSWRFAAEASPLAHLALRVRDAAALEVPEAADVPPPLAAPPQPATAAEPDLDPVLVGADWLSWWRELITLESDRLLLRPDQVTTSWAKVNRELEARQKLLARPPGFEGLSDRPGLQAAARAVGRTPRGWVDGQLQAERHSRALIDWPVVNEAVHQVATETGTPVHSLNGAALVLLVQGRWWRRVRPGLVLCSLRAAGDPPTAAELVRAALASAGDHGAGPASWDR